MVLEILSKVMYEFVSKGSYPSPKKINTFEITLSTSIRE